MSLYDISEPFDRGWLTVPGGHEIYYEQCGRPGGKPVVYLHGGPGGGFEPKHRGYFDPATYRVVLLDQRGAGRSRPFASLENNTTAALVADLERLRQHLAIDSWLIFGGSWGSTLALAYAQAHRHRVTGMILRGIFLGTAREIQWLYRPDGVAAFYPQEYRGFVAPIPEDERHDLLAAYHRRLLGGDEEERLACARAWSIWEGSLCRLLPDQEEIHKFSQPQFSLALARLESHYFVNGCFLREGQLLREIDSLNSIPAVILQGRYDMICPPVHAWELHRAWTGSRLQLVQNAGHAASEPAMTAALVAATDSFRD